MARKFGGEQRHNGVSGLSVFIENSLVITNEPVSKHPCTCTSPSQTCGTCRTDMSKRNPSSYPSSENIARYGAPPQN